MSRDTRETKMHYSPSEKDGVFVVEVTRGADTCNSNSEHYQKKHLQQKIDNHAANAFKLNNPDETVGVGGLGVGLLPGGIAVGNHHQQVQIHQPPDGISDDEILEVDEDGGVSMTSPRSSVLNTTRPNYGSSNTGLSQSDLSITSSNGSNQAYCYGNQEAYTIEGKGYPTPPVARATFCEGMPNSHNDSSNSVVTATDHNSNPHSNTNNTTNSNPNRPVITAALLKQDTIVDASNSFRDNGEPCRLMSDVLAEESHNEEKLLEEQIKLGNGDAIKPIDDIHIVDDEVVVEVKKIIGETKMEIVSAVEDVPKMENCDIVKENGDGFDSLAYLPDPPTSEEIKQLNDVTLNENNNMDSLPPPPPPEIIIADGHNGNDES